MNRRLSTKLPNRSSKLTGDSNLHPSSIDVPPPIIHPLQFHDFFVQDNSPEKHSYNSYISDALHAIGERITTKNENAENTTTCVLVQVTL